MSKSGYLRLLILSLVAALIFGMASLFALGWLSHSVSGKHRGDFMIFIAASVERVIGETPLEDWAHVDAGAKIREALNSFRPPPPPDLGHFPPRPPHDERRGAHPPRPRIWLFDETGKLIFAEDKDPLPVSWEDLPKPVSVHEVVSSDGFFHLGVETSVIKLEHEPTLFLVLRDEHRPSLGPLFFTQALITFCTLLMALFFSLSLTFYYLRRKSVEARAVLLRLERGDLKARFEIQRFDEFGGLILDFNRMAEAIERLVARVHSTEGARKNLLQELGHDLRTPLTSLMTSFETVKLHFTKMSETERAEIFEMMGAEVEYIRELLENLMVIASLHEPNYKASTEEIRLPELLRQEMDQRRIGGRAELTWTLTVRQPVNIRGDAHLIQRMFRNIFDNAARYAQTSVTVTLTSEDGQAVIRTRDDGPGLAAAALESFGKRQEKRTRRDDQRLNFSLGLGSVIMKAIAELHSGTAHIENDRDRGAMVTIRLPLAD